MIQLDLLFDTSNRGGEWTETAIEELVRLVHADGLNNATVATRLGRTHGAIESAVNRFCPRSPDAKRRDCMTCRRPFFSSHRGNRICGRCKESSAFSEFDHRYLECA